MDGVGSRFSAVLHLTRITTAFAAVGNVWFVILWTRGMPAEELALAPSSPLLQRSLWEVLGGGALYALGIYVFAMALNDTLDVRRDRALNPDRPLAAGRLSLEWAVWVVALALIAAVLGAAVLGMSAVLVCLLTAMLVMAFDSAAKYVPSVGLVLLGLIYAAHMLAANVSLLFVWPVWLAMTHALVLGAVAHRVSGRRPLLTGPMLAAAGAGWVFWSAALLWLGRRRVSTWWPDWVAWDAAVWVGVLAAVFVVVGWWKCQRAGSGRRAAEKLQRYGALWLTLYAAAWLASADLRAEALILGGLAAVGFAGMTVLREVYSLVEHPVGYRR